MHRKNEQSDDENVCYDEGEFPRLKSENNMLKKRNKCLEGDVKDLKKEVADMRQIVANIKGNELMYTVSLLDLQRCQKTGAHASLPFSKGGG